MSTVVVVGGTGFIGSACVAALSEQHQVRLVRAPRLRTDACSTQGLGAGLDLREVERFASTHLTGVEVLVNAAGLAGATSGDLQGLMGANAMLPLFLAKAAISASVSRFVHISSAAVQGRDPLDEGERLRPATLYGVSKALGEVTLRSLRDVEVIRYRPTSVQGPERAVTKQLLRLAESPLASIAAPGDDPSPQTSPERVAQAVSLLADSGDTPPTVVLHPWEGATTRSVLMDLGAKEPRVLSRGAARRAVALSYAVSRNAPYMRGHARRLEMMMFGQRQGSGWLDERLAPIHPDWLRECRQAMGDRKEGRAR